MANPVLPTIRRDLLTQPLLATGVPLVSSIEMYGISSPKYIGQAWLKDMKQNSILGTVLSQGNEFTVDSEQLVWAEKTPLNLPVGVHGQGMVTRSGNNFTLTAAALQADAYDIDANRPLAAKWTGFEVGQTIAVIDSTGLVVNGVITAVSADGKVLTAESYGVEDWEGLKTSNLEVANTGYNLASCECPPCISYQEYFPIRETSMKKDGTCVSYCKEDLIARKGASSWMNNPYIIGSVKSYIDEQIDYKHRVLFATMANAFLYDKRLTEDEAAAQGIGRGFNGIMNVLSARATKFQGLISTVDHLYYIYDLLKLNGISQATMMCSTAQMREILDIVNNSSFEFDPFIKRDKDMLYLGLFKGINFGDVQIIFGQCDELSGQFGYQNLLTAYPFIIIPSGKVNFTLNGRTREAGYLNVAWFGNENEVWKFRREYENPECGREQIPYVSKFAPVILYPEKFILGIPETSAAA